ncbi:right-handed parallel beta-helix repeat-containing protein [Thermoproteota archaeon]
MRYLKCLKSIPITFLIILCFTLNNAGHLQAQPVKKAKLAKAKLYPIEIKIEADYILKCQIRNHPLYPQATGAINNVRGYNLVYPNPDYIIPGENAMAIMGLIVASQRLNSVMYLNRARLAADYFLSVQNTDGSWYNKYDYVNGHDLGKYSRHTAEMVMAFHKLGQDVNRYISMKDAANYLVSRFNSTFNLIDGGLDSQGSPVSQYWLTDNCFAYHAFMAAYDWAKINGEYALALQYADYAGKIISGINTYFLDANTPVWYMRLDSNGQPQENSQYPSWVKYAPQLYDVPVKRVDNLDVGEWIKTSFQQPDGSCIGYEYDTLGNKTNTRKYPGHAFQSALCWQRIGGAQIDYAQDAIVWAKTSGLWQRTPDTIGVVGGWIDWIEVEPNPGAIPQDWERYIDTSALAIFAFSGGYDFNVANFTLNVPQDFSTIQEAIDASWDSCTILVADGTYTGVGNVNLDFSGRKITLKSENGAQSTIIDCESVIGQRGFNFSHTEEKFATVEGFTIKNGQAVWPNNAGGGMYIIAQSSPTIKDCIFIGNRAHNGGGIYFGGHTNSVVSGCTFEDNEAYWSTSITGRGGGVMCDISANVKIKDCEFINNEAASVGGGISCVSYSSPEIIDSTFDGNHAGGAGGAFHCDKSSPRVTDCKIVNNTSGNAGAALYCTNPSGTQESNPVFTNCLIKDNIVFDSNSDAGAIYSVYAKPEFYNCTLTGNVSGRKGAALYCNDPYPIMRDCIVWGNTPIDEQIYVWYAGDIDASYSDIQLGYPGVENIDSDPLFVSGPQGFYYLSQTAAGQPQDSPCVDTGSDTAQNIALDSYTTRTDHQSDVTIVDMGYHYPVP